MIPIASDNIDQNYVTKNIQVKLDSKTAILFKRLRMGLERVNAFRLDGSEPSVSMALRELIIRAAAEAVEVGQDGKPIVENMSAKQETRQPESSATTHKPRLPKGSK